MARRLPWTWIGIVSAAAFFLGLGWWQGSFPPPAPAAAPPGAGVGGRENGAERAVPALADGRATAVGGPVPEAAPERAGASAGMGPNTAAAAGGPDRGRAVASAGPAPAGEPAGGAEGEVHVVRPGETLYRIARRYQTTVETLAAANDLGEGAVIHPGQPLKVPGNGERTHRVREGETAWEIARRHGVNLAALAAANPDVANLGFLQVGQELVLPAAAGPGDIAVDAAAADQLAALARPGTFVWPVQGAISDAYGDRIHPITGRQAFHTGIDIAADHGTPVRAARAGVVDHAGWVNGFGKTVIVQHPDGTRTLYAHASQLQVEPGERVTQGQTIARVGSTGISTGPHLHFEIIFGRPIDPEPYLP